MNNKDLTLAEYLMYNETIGMTVEINDGQVVRCVIEEA